MSRVSSTMMRFGPIGPGDRELVRRLLEAHEWLRFLAVVRTGLLVALAAGGLLLPARELWPGELADARLRVLAAGAVAIAMTLVAVCASEILWYRRRERLARELGGDAGRRDGGDEVR